MASTSFVLMELWITRAADNRVISQLVVKELTLIILAEWRGGVEVGWWGNRDGTVVVGEKQEGRGQE